jgi:hypothetical protein
MTDDKDQQPDPEFESRLRDALASDARDIAPEIAERLAVMRTSAVAQFERTPRRFQFSWVAASGVAAALATVTLAAGLFLFSRAELVPEMPAAVEPEFAAAQDLELLTELEFLAWLEEEASNAG